MSALYKLIGVKYLRAVLNPYLLASRRVLLYIDNTNFTTIAYDNYR